MLVLSPQSVRSMQVIDGTAVSDRSRPASPPADNNRRARRRRAKEKIEKGEPDARGSPPSEKIPEAGPSKLPEYSQAPQSGPSTFQEEEFISLKFDDEGNEDEEEAEEMNSSIREWDRDKGKGRDYDGLAKKRKVDDVDFGDGYASKKQRVDAASRRAPWAVDVDWDHCNNVAEMLHREVDAFVTYISPTPVEDEVRSLIVALVSKAVTSAFPDAQVLPFGSYETKLYLPLGDIDLVIESQSMAYSNKTAVLHALANTVKRAGITDKVTIIAKAKVPIIKFVTRHGRFSVDMSINQVNGIAAGKMVKQFLDELPALRSLVLIIKSFLNQRSMNEVFTGGLGSYSIVCLAISFLQQHPKIRRGEIDPSKNLGALVMEFFELYGCYFNYREVGISLTDGGSYYNKGDRGWLDYRNPGLLSIEDPGDPSNDISRGTYGIAKVRTTLAGAYNIMAAAMYMHATYISARRERRYVRLQDRVHPEDMSILSSVMGVTQETINHRKVVQEVFDQRVLHRMLGVEPALDVPEVKVSSRQLKGTSRTVASSKPPPKGPKSMSRMRAAEEESVHSAWEEADEELELDDRRHEKADEEESRYGIDVRQPPKKRRRLGTHMDVHTVFTTDEEEVYDLDDPEDDMEEALQVSGQGGRIPKERSEKSERTRSYWLSKAMGGSGLSDSE